MCAYIHEYACILRFWLSTTRMGQISVGHTSLNPKSGELSRNTNTKFGDKTASQKVILFSK